jgi:hypothetical protein
MKKVEKEREIWGQLNHEHVLPLYGFTRDFGKFGALISPVCFWPSKTWSTSSHSTIVV